MVQQAAHLLLPAPITPSMLLLLLAPKKLSGVSVEELEPKVSCHYARELTQLQVIAPQRVATDQNLEDIFTKSLRGVAFKTLGASFVKCGSDVICSRGGVGR